ncbi:hypothetical protein BGZ60DRAFT_535868 [Tricladium varicosporioides]|nr:hypothetical protein BGZ60DRAFT_535868 [Hymenoscyphus varicosporioides]
MAIFTTLNYFLFLAAVATILLWGMSLWNGTVAELILTSWNGRFADGTPFETNYTGIFPLDFPISLLVAFFFYGSNGSHSGYQLFLLDAYSNLEPAFVWLYIESARTRAKPYSIANPIMWGLMWQAFGAAIALPLYFFNHLTWLESISGDLGSANLPSAMSLPFSFVIGAVFPTIIGMLPTWIRRPAIVHQQILAFWQPSPVWVSLLQIAFVASIRAMAVDVSKAFRWTKASYILAATLSALGHLYVVFIMATTSDSALSFKRMYVPFFFSEPEGAVQKLANGPWLFLQYDLVIIVLSSLSWGFILVNRTLSNGSTIRLFLPLLMALGAMILGSGATVSLALLWRECALQQGSASQISARKRRDSGGRKYD